VSHASQALKCLGQCKLPTRLLRGPTSSTHFHHRRILTACPPSISGSPRRFHDDPRLVLIAREYFPTSLPSPTRVDTPLSLFAQRFALTGSQSLHPYSPLLCRRPVISTCTRIPAASPVCFPQRVRTPLAYFGFESVVGK
jgi:hypothetical protein